MREGWYSPGLVPPPQESPADGENNMKLVAFAMTVFASPLLVWGQGTPSATQSSDVWTPAKSIGMYAYPKNQQTSDQQLKDESECYGSARQHTGVDPQASPPAGPTPEEQKAAQEQAAQQAGKSTPKGGTVKGSAGGLREERQSEP